MEKRLNNSNYVVFGLVLLVLVMGVISVVRAPANDFVGHPLSSILGINGAYIDSNNDGIVDAVQSLQANDGTLISAEIDPNDVNNVLLTSAKNIIVNNNAVAESVQIKTGNRDCLLNHVSADIGYFNIPPAYDGAPEQINIQSRAIMAHLCPTAPYNYLYAELNALDDNGYFFICCEQPSNR